VEQKELEVTVRTSLGSTAMKRARKSGMLPGVVYASGKEAQPVEMNQHDFIMTVRGSVPAQLFKLKSEDSSLNGKITIVKELQKEPLQDKLLHVDFLAIKEGQSITVNVPVQMEGEPQAVREGRAMLNQNRYDLEIECVPASLPEFIVVDVSNMEEGESIHAKDISLPEGAVLMSVPGQTVISLFGNRRLAAAAAAADTAGETAAPAAAAPAAEGEAGEAAEAPADGSGDTDEETPKEGSS